MRNRTIVSVLLSSILLCAGFSQAPVRGWLSVNPDSLCVTEGAVDKVAGGHLSVNTPTMRAYINAWTSQSIEVRFTYLGPTRSQAALGSGEIRRQFWTQAARSGSLQPGLRDVAHRSRVKAGGIGKDKSERAHQRGMRKPWL